VHRAPGIPCALCSAEGRTLKQNSREIRGEIVKLCLNLTSLREAKRRSNPFLSRKMGCRVKPGNDDAVDNWGTGRADNGHSDRYINPARHVRAFGVGFGIANDGIDTIERRP
jgi:hypothetical protein